ncbi:MAG: class I SAM-dependent methyltransferase [Polyangiaceae bacterium]
MSDEARRFFDSVAGRYERAYGLTSDESRSRMARVLAELPPAPSAVLDLGVGTGRELTALLDSGREVTGIDVSPAMLERCARRARPVPLVEADFWAPLPLADRSFDAAIALHGTLAHPPDDDAIPRLARELERVLRPGSPWVVEVPAPAWLETAADEHVTRTGPATAVYEDAVTGARIATRLLSAAEWTAALGRGWSTRVEAAGAAEWLVVARLAR